jgi:hypothetical protein
VSAVDVTTDVDGAVCIRVSVPADQVAGEYLAAVVDDTTNVAVGTLTIVVSDPE